MALIEVSPTLVSQVSSMLCVTVAVFDSRGCEKRNTVQHSRGSPYDVHCYINNKKNFADGQIADFKLRGT